MAYSPTNNPITSYFRTSYQELRKVAWPSRQEAAQHALIVIGLSLAVAVFFGAVDYLLSWGLELLIAR